MAKKFVIETVQVVKRTYYVEVDDPSWAMDSIVCSELEEYSQTFLTEDIVSSREVEQWPVAIAGVEQGGYEASVNGAVCRFQPATNSWDISADWSFVTSSMTGQLARE